MPRMSRTKGANAEREVCALVEAWWSELEPGCVYKRTPSSGGWATPAARAGFKTSGDVVTTARRWPFTVEVKRRENWAWKNVLAGKPSPVWGWWRQALAQGAECGMEPMLWLRRSNEPWSVMVRREYWDRKRLPPRGSLFVPDARVLGGDFPVLAGWRELLEHPPRRFALRAC